MLLGFFRKNAVLLLVLIAYLLTIGLTTVLIDKSIYQPQKQSMVWEDWNGTLNLSYARLQIAGGIATRALNSNAPLESYQSSVVEIIEQQFEAANGVWKIEYVGEGDIPIAVVEDHDRIREFNDWSNSLFFRDFNHEIKSGGGGTVRMLIHYTSPRDIAEIEQLTAHFRWIILMVWVGITCAFYIATRTVILPIRRVMNRVADGGAQLLRSPGSPLERGYNAVATQALGAQLSQRVTDLVQTPSLWTDAEFDPPMVEAAQKIFDFRGVALIAIEPTAPTVHIRAMSYSVGHEGIEAEVKEAQITYDGLEPGTPVKLVKGMGENLGLVTMIAPVLETASSRLGILICDVGDWSVMPRWHREVVEATAAEMRRGLTQMPVFRDYLFRQKSEANISLARSLGHDLTNVIATSKFDILAIKTWLRKRLKRMEAEGTVSTEHEIVLAESVQGLLNTTKFMQEIVNIYRAFSYLEEPKWEEVDFNDLVNHLCDLFRLTLSRRIEVVTDLGEGIPQVMCEPRLVQLALFNLLTNANQAIKRKGEHVSGAIEVSTRRVDEDWVEISMRDTGPGIRGAEGELLSGDELYQIFFLGITTRREGEDKGEGLGLNWVWAIIRDFHGGEIIPDNHPEGGAIFNLRMPIAGREEKTTDEENSDVTTEETSDV